MNRMRPVDRGFTLIELLVVIGIMVLLAAILLPTVLRAIGQAEKVQASSDVKQIETAIKAYFNEYGRYPAQDKSEDFLSNSDSKLTNVISILRGLNDTENPRRIQFLEVPAKSLVRNKFVDPWDNHYMFAYDGDFDNYIRSIPGLTLTGRQVAVWSVGPDGEAYNKDDVRSW